jgi:hypothetical protein
VTGFYVTAIPVTPQVTGNRAVLSSTLLAIWQNTGAPVAPAEAEMLAPPTGRVMPLGR